MIKEYRINQFDNIDKIHRYTEAFHNIEYYSNITWKSNLFEDILEFILKSANITKYDLKKISTRQNLENIDNDIMFHDLYPPRRLLLYNRLVTRFLVLTQNSTNDQKIREKIHNYLDHLEVVQQMILLRNPNIDKKIYPIADNIKISEDTEEYVTLFLLYTTLAKKYMQIYTFTYSLHDRLDNMLDAGNSESIAFIESMSPLNSLRQFEFANCGKGECQSNLDEVRETGIEPDINEQLNIYKRYIDQHPKFKDIRLLEEKEENSIINKLRDLDFIERFYIYLRIEAELIRKDERSESFENYVMENFITSNYPNLDKRILNDIVIEVVKHSHNMDKFAKENEELFRKIGVNIYTIRNYLSYTFHIEYIITNIMYYFMSYMILYILKNDDNDDINKILTKMDDKNIYELDDILIATNETSYETYIPFENYITLLKKRHGTRLKPEDIVSGITITLENIDNNLRLNYGPIERLIIYNYFIKDDKLVCKKLRKVLSLIYPDIVYKIDKEIAEGNPNIYRIEEMVPKVPRLGENTAYILQDIYINLMTVPLAKGVYIRTYRKLEELIMSYIILSQHKRNIISEELLTTATREITDKTRDYIYAIEKSIENKLNLTFVEKWYLYTDIDYDYATYFMNEFDSIFSDDDVSKIFPEKCEYISEIESSMSVQENERTTCKRYIKDTFLYEDYDKIINIKHYISSYFDIDKQKLEKIKKDIYHFPEIIIPEERWLVYNHLAQIYLIAYFQ